MGGGGAAKGRPGIGPKRGSHEKSHSNNNKKKHGSGKVQPALRSGKVQKQGSGGGKNKATPGATLKAHEQRLSQSAKMLVNNSGLSTTALCSLLDETAQDLALHHNIKVKSSNKPKAARAAESQMACEAEPATPVLPAVHQPQQQLGATDIGGALDMLTDMMVATTKYAPKTKKDGNVFAAGLSLAALPGSTSTADIPFNRSAEGSHVPV